MISVAMKTTRKTKANRSANAKMEITTARLCMDDSDIFGFWGVAKKIVMLR